MGVESMSEPRAGLSIDDVRGLSNPARRALAGAAVASLAELAMHSEQDIANLQGMGPTGIRLLKETMADDGFKFAHD